MYSLFGYPSQSSSKSGNDTPVASKSSKSDSSDWEVSLGPLSFGSKGVDMKPQMKLGVSGANMNAEFGIGDVRDGLSFAAQAEASATAKAEGWSLHELHENIHCDTVGFREALATTKALLSGTGNAGAEVISDIAEKIGYEREKLEMLLKGKVRTCGPMTLKVRAKVGIGVSAKVCLGWCDTEDFHMVGVGGKVRVGLGFGANIYAGKHTSGTPIKIILGIGNFVFEYTFPRPMRSKESMPASVDAPVEVDETKETGADTAMLRTPAKEAGEYPMSEPATSHNLDARGCASATFSTDLLD